MNRTPDLSGFQNLTGLVKRPSYVTPSQEKADLTATDRILRQL